MSQKVAEKLKIALLRGSSRCVDIEVVLPYASDYISDIANMMKKNLQVNWVAPGHCTGDSAHKIFKELYQDNYKYFGLGSRIKY